MPVDTEPSELEKRVEEASQRILLNVFVDGGYVGSSGKIADLFNVDAVDRILNDARTVASALAASQAECERLRNRLRCSTMPVPNMQELKDIAADNAALRQQVEGLSGLLRRHRTIFLGTVGFGAIVEDIDAALSAQPAAEEKGE